MKKKRRFRSRDLLILSIRKHREDGTGDVVRNACDADRGGLRAAFTVAQKSVLDSDPGDSVRDSGGLCDRPDGIP